MSTQIVKKYCWIVWVSNNIPLDDIKTSFGQYFTSSFTRKFHHIIGLHDCSEEFLIKLKQNEKWKHIKFCKDQTIQHHSQSLQFNSCQENCNIKIDTETENIEYCGSCGTKMSIVSFNKNDGYCNRCLKYMG
jgi:hypothetical protein